MYVKSFLLLFLCVSVVNRIRLCIFGGSLPHIRHAVTQIAKAVELRERPAALSGLSRTTRRHKMLIQRLAPSHPPAISADLMQFVQ